jgi:hypothetical protein
LTIVDTRKTYPVPTGLGHAISYLPAQMVTAADETHYRASHDERVRSRARGGGGDSRMATVQFSRRHFAGPPAANGTDGGDIRAFVERIAYEPASQVVR